MATTRRLAILVSLAGAFWLAPAARLAAGGGGVTRTYYIAADEVVWDYAPSGANAAEGRAFNEAEKPWMEAGPHVAGRKVKKAIYREYTDATFTTRKPHPPEWEHLGFLGPLVRAEVGDTMPERAARRQLRVLDVSLAQRRDPRRRERPDRTDDRHPQGHGAARRIAHRR